MSAATVAAARQHGAAVVAMEERAEEEERVGGGASFAAPLPPPTYSPRATKPRGRGVGRGINCAHDPTTPHLPRAFTTPRAVVGIATALLGTTDLPGCRGAVVAGPAHYHVPSGAWGGRLAGLACAVWRVCGGRRHGKLSRHATCFPALKFKIDQIIPPRRGRLQQSANRETDQHSPGAR